MIVGETRDIARRLETKRGSFLAQKHDMEYVTVAKEGFLDHMSVDE
jgi:hypothetical protein